MGVQHEHGAPGLFLLHGGVNIVHSIICHVQTPAPVLYFPDDLVLKSTGTKGIGQRFDFFYVCHDFLQV